MAAGLQPGKVYLVGAGPGHPELLTIKAAELLRTGDVIIYDRLIQEEVLSLVRPSAERIYMGKPVGKHESRQEEIHELLVRKAREGKSVIRLKGGDPFLFGRGGEEAEYLADHGIPFEVIPGVCSALSAPLSAGISVTHRDASSSVAIVTGHNCNGAGARIDWNALARIDTLVFLMGVHNAEKIASRLIAAGLDPATPAAMVQMAFWHDEQVVTATVATLADECRRAQVKSPATIVIGGVVRLREKLAVSQRDLSRAGDHAASLGPAPDELLRIAMAGLGSQVLGWALETGLFDRLEEPQPVCDLAHALDLNTEALSEMLRTLVAMRLIESTPEGYRNLELASRYLRRDSRESLRESLLNEIRQFGECEALAQFARHGRQSRLPSPTHGTRAAAAEAFARLAGPAVMKAIAAAPDGPVLVIGFGGPYYASSLRAARPSRVVEVWNPFATQAAGPPSGHFAAVIVSGVLDWCRATDLQSILSRIEMDPGGLLLCHDAMCSVGEHPAAHTALRVLARQVLDGDTHSWSVERVVSCLERAGFEATTHVAFSTGGALLTARRTASVATAAD